MPRDSGANEKRTVLQLNDEHMETGCRLAFVFLGCNRPQDAADLLMGLRVLAPGHELVARLLVVALFNAGDSRGCLEEARLYLRSWPTTDHGEAIRVIEGFAEVYHGGNKQYLQDSLRNWQKAS